MKVYISGKIGNGKNKDDNIIFMNEMVRIARKETKDYNVEIINPLELNIDQDNWHNCMKQDIIAVCQSDAILMLPNWITSPGANLELHIASRLQIPIFLSLNDLLGFVMV